MGPLFILGTRKIWFPGLPKIQNILWFFKCHSAFFGDFLKVFLEVCDFCKEPKNFMTDSKSKKKPHCFFLISMHNNYTTFFFKRKTLRFSDYDMYFFLYFETMVLLWSVWFFNPKFGLLIPWTRKSYNVICL